MAIVLPNQGEKILLDLLLSIGMTMKLYKVDVTAGLTATQKEALTEASFTEATFSGYTSKALAGGFWATTASDPSTGIFAQQSWTRTVTGTTETIYGYYMTRTSDGKLLWFERFTGPVGMTTNGDILRVTPTITLEDDQEATVAARGVVGTPQILTAASSSYSATGATDFALNNVPVDGTRQYRVHLQSFWNMSAPTGNWYVYARMDGVNTLMMDIATNNLAGFISASALWLPDTATVNMVIYLSEIAGTTTLSFYADSTAPRQFWVEDVGPR